MQVFNIFFFIALIPPSLFFFGVEWGQNRKQERREILLRSEKFKKQLTWLVVLFVYSEDYF